MSTSHISSQPLVPGNSFSPDKPGEYLFVDKDKNLTGNDFMKLLVLQLQNQNPLEPMNSADMMGQISSLTSTRLSESLDSFAKMQNSALGQGMLGREVTIQTTDNMGHMQEVSGLVSAIQDLGQSTCKIEVNGKYYKPTSVVRIANESANMQKMDANLLGKSVVLDVEGSKITGEVTAISSSKDGPRIWVQKKAYDPKFIQEIRLKEREA